MITECPCLLFHLAKAVLDALYELSHNASQGGLGTINAVTAQDNGNRYKVMYAASVPTLQISVDLLKAPFDISGVKIPCFMVAGTKKVDAGDGKNSGICCLMPTDI